MVSSSEVKAKILKYLEQSAHTETEIALYVRRPRHEVKGLLTEMEDEGRVCFLAMRGLWEKC